MTYTLKALLIFIFSSLFVQTGPSPTCEELIENIIYEGVFYGGMSDSDLNSPFLKNVTAYIYQDEIHVIATNVRDESTIYCNVPKEDWDSFQENCSCSYSKKFNKHIRPNNCDCSSEE